VGNWIMQLSLAAAISLASLASRADVGDEVDAALDAFHAAAARADLDTYLDLLTQDVVFLGTDASERWQGEAFRAFARARFSTGAGWTYTPRQREVRVGADGSVAWFDERLDNPELGECRGSGVLVRQGGDWKVAQYNLSLPVPSGLAPSVAAAIASGASVVPASAVSSPSPGAGSATGSAATGAMTTEPEKKRCPRRHKTNRPADC
jgi:hypothetical protein